jgi:hypothetical protein
MPDARCYLCLSDKQLAAVQTVVLCRILNQLDPMACNISDLLAESQEYLFLGTREMAAVQTALLCLIYHQSSGPTTGGSVIIDTVDPVADPGMESQLWINRTTGGVWYWNDTTDSWVSLIV